jgi:hypothetical protein
MLYENAVTHFLEWDGEEEYGSYVRQLAEPFECEISGSTTQSTQQLRLLNDTGDARQLTLGHYGVCLMSDME